MPAATSRIYFQTLVISSFNMKYSGVQRHSTRKKMLAGMRHCSTVSFTVYFIFNAVIVLSNYYYRSKVDAF